jgi:glycosyltransferase involved in cell wall biosynthesis
MDVFVLSSDSEGLSVTLLEAMAQRLPVVATAVGGNPEVVVEGETGLLVPRRAPEALAGAVAALLADPDRRRALGGAGRRRVEAHFSRLRMLREYQALYQEVSDSNRRVPTR